MLRIGLVVALVLAFSAPAASADVLISAIPRTLVCGDAIAPGIWAQAGTRGSRTVRMRAIDDRTGKVWWRKTAKAPFDDWRYWHLPSGMDGECRPTTVVYKGPGFTTRYKIRFRSEGV
ncbi:hypothetical protein [Solirubrobacter deserti]|uniref:Uncharacterized protein n=1 Tax=Solirubrobacter deserti TaxID=2282478 RepID=A0ABT4RCN0_9ACTN|nr:hypothetical protein [Solirubrobacter deserti]MDA0136294.1 hypothetical protein [Solirubrobacter deserti]